MSQDREYIDQEIAQIRFIYETLYPETPVEAHMWWEEAKLETPAVQPHDLAYGAEMMALSYIATGDLALNRQVRRWASGRF